MSEQLKSGPERAQFLHGKWISVVDGKVVEHHSEQSYDLNASSDTNTVEFSLKIKGKGSALLSQIVNIGGGAISPTAYATQPTQYNEYPATVPMSRVDADTDDRYSITDTEPLDVTPGKRRPIVDGLNWSLQGDEEKRRANKYSFIRGHISKRAILTSAVVSFAIISGPATQASYASDQAVEICAKEGLTTILGDPACFTDQFLATIFNPENLFNYLPPETK